MFHSFLLQLLWRMVYTVVSKILSRIFQIDAESTGRCLTSAVLLSVCTSVLVSAGLELIFFTVISTGFLSPRPCLQTETKLVRSRQK